MTTEGFCSVSRKCLQAMAGGSRQTLPLYPASALLQRSPAQTDPSVDSSGREGPMILAPV